MKGFSLVEVLVAMAVVATSATGLAGLLTLATRVVHQSRIDMVATAAADAKMAELRALPFGDFALAPTPTSSLQTNAAGCVDFVDATGAMVSTGTNATGQSVYLRRWRIQPLPADPVNAVVLEVVAAAVGTPRSPLTHLVSILARTTP